MKFSLLRKKPENAKPSIDNDNLAQDLVAKEHELERTQDEFLSITSHELRTPLTVIKGNTSIIRQYYWEQLPNDEVRGMINDMQQASEKMIELINNFLDTLRLEQKLVKFDLQSFDILSLVKSVVQNSSKQGVEVTVKEAEAPLKQVMADKKWTERVFSIVLGNALKFTDRGNVTISVVPEGDFMRILVTDTGRGISHEAQNLIFRKFAKTNENVLTRDSEQGTTPGLYMAKLIMEQMGGSIQLESTEPGRGSTFSITLPVNKSHN